MFKKVFFWLAAPPLTIALWWAFWFLLTDYRAELKDLSKFTGDVTSIWFEKRTGKSTYYQLCFDFDNYRYQGFIDSNELSPLETVYQQMRGQPTMTVYFSHPPLGRANKSVVVCQLENRQKVFYSLKDARQSSFSALVYTGVMALVMTLAVGNKIYEDQKNKTASQVSHESYSG